MKQTVKRLLSLVMVLIMVGSLAISAFADVDPNDGSVTVRANAKKNATVWVTLAYGDKKFTIKRADVKVYKGTSGAKLTQFEKSTSNNTSASWWYDASTKKWTKDSSYSGSNYEYGVGLTVQQAGTATVKYKIGSKEYKLKVTVEPYKNPIKSMTLTKYKSGKNFATKAAAYKNIKLTSNISNAKLKIAAASGWTISSISIADMKTGVARQQSFGPGVSSATFQYGKMLKSHRYSIFVSFNHPTYGYQYISYTVN